MITFINALITSTAETLKINPQTVVNDSQCQHSPSLKSYGNYELLT